jgi:hypothetical protein
MRTSSRELLDRLRHASAEIERFFRIRLAEAESAPDAQAARMGLRNAVGARRALDRWPATERTGVGSAHN